MKKVIKWLDRNFELFILMVMLVAFSSVMMLQIIMRYIFKSPFTWAEEFCRYAFVASVAFISSFCVRANVLLKVDAIVNALPKPVQKVLNVLMWLTMIAVYGTLAVRGVTVVQSAYDKQQITAAMSIPFWLLYLLMEIGFVLTVLRSIQAMIKGFLGISDEPAGTAAECAEQAVKQAAAAQSAAGEGKGGAST